MCEFLEAVSGGGGKVVSLIPFVHRKIALEFSLKIIVNEIK